MTTERKPLFPLTNKSLGRLTNPKCSVLIHAYLNNTDCTQQVVFMYVYICMCVYIYAYICNKYNKYNKNIFTNKYICNNYNKEEAMHLRGKFMDELEKEEGGGEIM